MAQFLILHCPSILAIVLEACGIAGDNFLVFLQSDVRGRGSYLNFVSTLTNGRSRRHKFGPEWSVRTSNTFEAWTSQTQKNHILLKIGYVVNWINGEK